MLEERSIDILPCAACGRQTHIDDLDAKPDNLAHFERPRGWRDWLLRIFCPTRWRLEALDRAADAGAQFERLECEVCYGPGYISLRAK